MDSICFLISSLSCAALTPHSLHCAVMVGMRSLCQICGATQTVSMPSVTASRGWFLPAAFHTWTLGSWLKDRSSLTGREMMGMSSSPSRNAPQTTPLKFHCRDWARSLRVMPELRPLSSE